MVVDEEEVNFYSINQHFLFSLFNQISFNNHNSLSHIPSHKIGSSILISGVGGDCGQRCDLWGMAPKIRFELIKVDWKMVWELDWSKLIWKMVWLIGLIKVDLKDGLGIGFDQSWFERWFGNWIDQSWFERWLVGLKENFIKNIHLIVKYHLSNLIISHLNLRSCIQELEEKVVQAMEKWSKTFLYICHFYLVDFEWLEFWKM